jgi:cytochrome c peroxidase
LGLAAGQSQIKGLQENPMTRAKVELGRQLYFDPRLSKDQSVSCSSCHSPDEGYGAHTQFGVGILKQTGNRNSPVAYNRLLSDLQFWDGRASSLEEQAKGPIANPIEMGHTHEACLSCLKEVPGYVLQFDKVFGGELSIDTVAKAIATFERALITSPAPFDYGEQMRTYAGVDLDDLKTDDPDVYNLYEKAKVDADAHPMSESAVRGRAIFFGEKGSCTACHVGPNLSDEKYHNIGVGMSAEKPDLGRFEITKVEADKGAFKTPTIRNVATSAPYMHDGSQKTLEEVVEFYNKGGEPNQWLDPKIKKLNLTDQEKKDLVAFMEACTGDFPKVERGRLPPEN